MNKTEISIGLLNIRQQGKTGKKIPLFLLDEFKNLDIVILNEFNCKAENIDDFYSKLKSRGFAYYTANYDNCRFSNDTFVAIRSDKPIQIVRFWHHDAYYEPPKTYNRLYDYDTVPENLCLKLNMNGKSVTLFAIRIKTLRENYDKRKSQFDWLKGRVSKETGSVIIAGDFNNAYHPNKKTGTKNNGLLYKDGSVVRFKDVEKGYYNENNEQKLQYNYNLHIIQEELYDMGFMMLDDGSPTHKNYLSEDHIFVKGLKGAGAKPNFSFMTKKNGYAFANVCKNQEKNQPPGLPDHALLTCKIIC